MSASVFRKSAPQKKPEEKKSIPSVFKPSEEKSQPRKVGNYEITDEDLERMGERGQAKAISRLVEGAAALPGNIAGFLNKVTGNKIAPLSGMAQFLPGTEQIKEFSEKATGGYTAPEGELDKIAGEYLQDVGSYLPFAGAGAALGTGSRAINFLRTWQPFLSPLVGQATKQSTKKLGGKEGTQDWMKLGAMIAFDVFANRGRGAQGYINHLFQEAEQAIPRGARTNANNLRNTLLTLESDLQRGGTSPDKASALTKIQEIMNSLHQRGQNFFIDVAELPAFRKSINSLREQLGGWKSELPPGVRRRAIRNLEKVKNLVIETGMDYGTHSNPTFGHYWKAANEASNIASRSNVATKFLHQVLGGKMATKILGGTIAGKAGHAALTGQSALGSLAHSGAVAGLGAATALPIYNIAKIGYRMTKSPVLRNYYNRLFRSGIQQDAGQVTKYANKIEKEEEKEDEKKKKLIKSILRD